MKKLISIIVLVFIFFSPLEGKIIHVPQDYPTIQNAIDASKDTDTVLVAKGIYLENINFHGKKIVVTSNYIFDSEPSTILSTIIDGGHSTNPDFQSCVMMVSNEDSSSVLQGFTLTHGKGSKWVDEHGAGIYREGGGILTALSSPTIKNNLIIDNEAIDKKGMISAGGGGIRSGDGNPKILNNVIMRNKGYYGCGITLNYTGAIVKNNIVYQNEGGAGYGGAGIWCNSNSVKGYKIFLDNNTIANNFCSSDGGGLLVWETLVTGVNNIIAYNYSAKQENASISLRTGGTVNLTYSNIENGLTGEGNISANPQLDITNQLLLAANSPCIDAGNPNLLFNDPENPNLPIPGQALFPSLGTIRNDMGAYGGKDRTFFPSWNFAPRIGFLTTVLDFKKVTIGDTGSVNFQAISFGEIEVRIDSLKITSNPQNFILENRFPLTISPSTAVLLNVKWNAVQSGYISDTLFIYHNDSTKSNPIKIKITGRGALPTTVEQNLTKPEVFGLSQNYPNPFNPETKIKFAIAKEAFVTLKVYNILGKELTTLINEVKSAGYYTFNFNAAKYLQESGIYFYRLQAGAFTETKKLILLK
ncbi:MAG: T9SS type A sorting domain-containing protein [Ignavibacteriales bacterium]|nr:T9SS type A sorting domain-containing protein [Ignavibacteriales bacterium]